MDTAKPEEESQDASSTVSVTKKLMREVKKKQKKDQDKAWAKTVSLKDDIVLSSDTKSIVSIKGLPLSGNAVSVVALVEILRINNVVVTRGNMKKDILIDILLQHLKGEPQRKIMSSASFKSKINASTHPLFVHEEGTIYRVVLSLTCEAGKRSFMNSGSRLTREEIDNGLRSANSLATNLIIYSDEDHPELESLGFEHELFTLMNVDQDVCKTYDKLSLSQFAAVVDHIHHHFQDAMIRNQKSGSHLTFANYVGSRYWLLLLHHRLYTNGCMELRQIVYPELPQVLTSLSQESTSSTDDLSVGPPLSPPKKAKNNHHNNDVQDGDAARKRLYLTMEKQKNMQLRASLTDRQEILIDKIIKTKERLDSTNSDPEINEHLKIILTNYKSELNNLIKEIQSIDAENSRA